MKPQKKHKRPNSALASPTKAPNTWGDGFPPRRPSSAKFVAKKHSELISAREENQPPLSSENPEQKVKNVPKAPTQSQRVLSASKVLDSGSAQKVPLPRFLSANPRGKTESRANTLRYERIRDSSDLFSEFVKEMKRKSHGLPRPTSSKTQSSTATPFTGMDLDLLQLKGNQAEIMEENIDLLRRSLDDVKGKNRMLEADKDRLTTRVLDMERKLRAAGAEGERESMLEKKVKILTRNLENVQKKLNDREASYRKAKDEIETLQIVQRKSDAAYEELSKKHARLQKDAEQLTKIYTECRQSRDKNMGDLSALMVRYERERSVWIRQRKELMFHMQRNKHQFTKLIQEPTSPERERHPKTKEESEKDAKTLEEANYNLMRYINELVDQQNKLTSEVKVLNERLAKCRCGHSHLDQPDEYGTPLSPQKGSRAAKEMSAACAQAAHGMLDMLRMFKGWKVTLKAPVRLSLSGLTLNKSQAGVEASPSADGSLAEGSQGTLSAQPSSVEPSAPDLNSTSSIYSKHGNDGVDVRDDVEVRAIRSTPEVEKLQLGVAPCRSTPLPSEASTFSGLSSRSGRATEAATSASLSTAAVLSDLSSEFFAALQEPSSHPSVSAESSGVRGRSRSLSRKDGHSEGPASDAEGVQGSMGGLESPTSELVDAGPERDLLTALGPVAEWPHPPTIMMEALGSVSRELRKNVLAVLCLCHTHGLIERRPVEEAPSSSFASSAATVLSAQASAVSVVPSTGTVGSDAPKVATTVSSSLPPVGQTAEPTKQVEGPAGPAAGEGACRDTHPTPPAESTASVGVDDLPDALLVDTPAQVQALVGSLSARSSSASEACLGTRSLGSRELHDSARGTPAGPSPRRFLRSARTDDVPSDGTSAEFGPPRNRSADTVFPASTTCDEESGRSQISAPSTCTDRSKSPAASYDSELERPVFDVHNEGSEATTTAGTSRSPSHSVSSSTVSGPTRALTGVNDDGSSVAPSLSSVSTEGETVATLFSDESLPAASKAPLGDLAHRVEWLSDSSPAISTSTSFPPASTPCNTENTPASECTTSASAESGTSLLAFPVTTERSIAKEPAPPTPCLDATKSKPVPREPKPETSASDASASDASADRSTSLGAQPIPSDPSSESISSKGSFPLRKTSWSLGFRRKGGKEVPHSHKSEGSEDSDRPTGEPEAVPSVPKPALNKRSQVPFKLVRRSCPTRPGSVPQSHTPHSATVDAAPADPSTASTATEPTRASPPNVKKSQAHSRAQRNEPGTRQHTRKQDTRSDRCSAPTTADLDSGSRKRKGTSVSDTRSAAGEPLFHTDPRTKSKTISGMHVSKHADAVRSAEKDALVSNASQDNPKLPSAPSSSNLSSADPPVDAAVASVPSNSAHLNPSVSSSSHNPLSDHPSVNVASSSSNNVGKGIEDFADDASTDLSMSDDEF
eukprot:Rmarinus@m.4964